MKRKAELNNIQIAIGVCFAILIVIGLIKALFTMPWYYVVGGVTFLIIFAAVTLLNQKNKAED